MYMYMYNYTSVLVLLSLSWVSFNLICILVNYVSHNENCTCDM